MAETGVGYQVSEDCSIESKDDWKTRQEKEYSALFEKFQSQCKLCESCYESICPFVIIEKIKNGVIK
ncbi:MAG: hypothetical protein WC516_09945 [Patescibacteria group bacterium]